jgi:hypothetical protein
MWKPQFNAIDSITGSAGAAVLCTLLTQRLSSRQSELCSETVCWMILPTLFKIANRSNISISTASFYGKPGSQSASSRSLWVFAVGIVIACSYKAEIGKIALFVSSHIGKKKMHSKVKLIARINSTSSDS